MYPTEAKKELRRLAPITYTNKKNIVNQWHNSSKLPDIKYPAKTTILKIVTKLNTRGQSRTVSNITNRSVIQLPIALTFIKRRNNPYNNEYLQPKQPNFYRLMRAEPTLVNSTSTFSSFLRYFRAVRASMKRSACAKTPQPKTTGPLAGGDLR